MVAILVQIAFAAGVPVRRVQCEAFDDILRHARRYATFPRDNAKAVKRRLTRGHARQRFCGQRTNGGKAFLRIGDRCHRAAMVLTIGHIIAFAAPRVEQPNAFARGPVKQPAGETEGLRTPRYAVLRKLNKGRAIKISHGKNLCKG